MKNHYVQSMNIMNRISKLILLVFLTSLNECMIFIIINKLHSNREDNITIITNIKIA